MRWNFHWGTKLALFLLCGPMVVTLPIMLYQQWVPIDPSPYSMHSRANGYQVFDASDHCIAYVLGTMHSNFSEEELKIWKSTLVTLLPKADYLALEIDLPHWSTLAMGVERKALEAVEQFSYKNHVVEVIAMEDLQAQYAMLSAIRMIGPYRVILPWGSVCESHPTLVQSINTWVIVSGVIPNIIYNLWINPQFLLDMVKQNAIDFAMMRQTFLQGETPVMTVQNIMPLRVEERDAQIYQKLDALLQDRPLKPDHYFILCLGAAHLSFDRGILFQLETHGYRLEPFPIVSI